MKLIFLVRSLASGGAERQLVALARELRLRGHPVKVAVFYPGGLLEDDLRVAGVPVLHLHKRGRWDVARFWLRLARLLRAERPDILHGYMDVANLLALTVKPVLPRLKVVWGIRSSQLDLRPYGPLRQAIDRLQRAAAAWPDLIIVNSLAGLEAHLARRFPRDKTVLIPNGIDVARFRPDPAGRVRVRAEWGVGESDLLVGLVGRIDPVKGHEDFLRAAELTSRRCPNARFACVGDGPADQVHHLQELSTELGLEGVVTWAGSRQDMPAVYSALDLLASCSYSEGFPNVVGEAMACEVPCVVTAAGDSTWIVGDTGVVVPPGDPPALADAWSTALSWGRDHRACLARAARARIAGEFSLEGLVSGSVDALEQL